MKPMNLENGSVTFNLVALMSDPWIHAHWVEVWIHRLTVEEARHIIQTGPEDHPVYRAFWACHGELRKTVLLMLEP